MTREEAKEILTHNWTRVDNPNYSESELDTAFFMAIEALQREEAEEKEYCHRIKPKEYFSTDAEWIPCSERLPEDTTMPVLISGRHKTVGIYAVDIARYNGGMWQYDGFTFPDCEVLAWMPLPKPYKCGDSE